MNKAISLYLFMILIEFKSMKSWYTLMLLLNTITE